MSLRYVHAHFLSVTESSFSILSGIHTISISKIVVNFGAILLTPQRLVKGSHSFNIINNQQLVLEVCQMSMSAWVLLKLPWSA